MDGRLITLDNNPDVRPVRVGETWRRLFAKCVLKVTAPEDTNVCQDDQICARPKVVICGTVHRVQDIWDANASTEDWGLLLVDKNAFNKRIGMIWTVHHLWSSGASF